MPTLDEKVGGLIVAVQAVQNDVREIKSDIKENARDANVWREQMVLRQSRFEDDMQDFRRDLDKVIPVAEMVNRWRWMGIGALWVTGVASAGVGAILTYYWQQIIAGLVQP